MKHLRRGLMLIVLALLAGCVTSDPAGVRFDPIATTTPASPLDAPFPTATSLPAPGAPQVAILSPLQIDSQANRLYAAAQVNGQPKLVVLDARDGRLLAAWDTVGQLALDAGRGRLIVDRGAPGVAVLDAASGETLTTVALPAQDGPPAPQVDLRTGLVYAFRDATLHVINPANGSVVESLPLSETRSVCDVPGDDAPIHQTAYDSSAGRLYLSFITYTCVPWVGVTLVAYDAAELTEIGRTEVDIRAQFVSHDGVLHGLTVSRLGPTLTWAWDGETRQDESSDYLGEPAGAAVDVERGLVYQAVGETIRTVSLRGDTPAGQVAVPLLAGNRLAGHNPATDTLYFVSPAGRLTLWPAENLFTGSAPALTAPSPLPAAPARSLVLSPNWANDGTMLAVVEDTRCAPPGGQLFVMLDPAVGWQPGVVPSNGPCATVAAVAFSPAYAHDSLLFAATNDPPTVLRSVDGGRSWTAAGFAFPPGTTFRALLVSPTYTADQVLFALAHSGELYRSRDGGRGWLLLDQRLDVLAVMDTPGPTFQLTGALDGQVLRSTHGDTWTTMGATPDGQPLVALALGPSAGPEPILYAFTAGGRLARSADGGASWSVAMETSPGAAQLAVAGAPEATRPVFLLQEGMITASYDGLASIWAATTITEAGRYRPTALAVPPNFATAPFLYIGTLDGQILRVRADAQP